MNFRYPYGLLIGIAPVVAPAAASSAVMSTVPLAPSAQWVIDGEAGECVLQRDYATTKSVMTIAFRLNPFDYSFSVLLVGKGDLPTGQASGVVELLPSGQIIGMDFLGDRLTDGRAMLQLSTKPETFLASNPLQGMQSVTVKVGHFSKSLATPGMDSALKVLDQCDQILAQSWGVDPQERSSIKKPAKELTKSSTWIPPEDYPKTALVAGIQGDTRVLYAVGVDGKPKNCKTVVSSGNKNLDAIACRDIAANAKFSPAEDSLGHMVESHRLDRINWRIGL